MKVLNNISIFFRSTWSMGTGWSRHRGGRSQLSKSILLLMIKMMTMMMLMMMMIWPPSLSIPSSQSSSCSWSQYSPLQPDLVINDHDHHSSSSVIIICHLSIRMILMISGTCIGMRILHRDQRHTPRDHGSCSRNRPVSNAWWEHHDHHCFCQDYHHIIYI